MFRSNHVVVNSSARLSLVALVSALALSACALTDDEPQLEVSSSAVGASCVLGDGYVIPSGGHLTAYPVTCPSDCFDFPNGGLDLTMFCNNGALGESDPALTGGSVAPLLTASQFNGYSRCTARPNPYSTPRWGQSANRKTCVRL